MKLFYSPGACSLAPHIVLREAGATFSLEKVDTGRHVTVSETDYYAINPKGQVPLLQLDDGTLLSEGPVIAQYIVDQAADKKLMPAAGSLARYRVMEWQNYITSELHKSFSPLFNPAFDTNAKALHTSLLRKKYEWVDSRLSGNSYLTSEDFTAADAYLFTITAWAKYTDLNLSDLANLQRFLARVAARPAVREAMKAEGLVT
ncbi:MAG: glutathione transferase GstA [Betaproteobacteria bacterium]|nr:glutathione transferase GstA [Betaproteobacteria bacterium]